LQSEHVFEYVLKEKNMRNQEFMMLMMIYQSEELDKDYGLYSFIHTSI